jgi:hypothetical protein
MMEDTISLWNTVQSRTLFHYEIMFMDNISYDILSGGHYFMDDTILCYKYMCNIVYQFIFIF